jgi:hypothetical protein
LSSRRHCSDFTLWSMSSTQKNIEDEREWESECICLREEGNIAVSKNVVRFEL